MRQSIDGWWRPVTIQVQGQRAITIEIDVPTDAPAELRDGLERQRLVNAGGRCPCGAVASLPDRAARRRAARRGELPMIIVRHSEDCTARLLGYLAVAQVEEADR